MTFPLTVPLITGGQLPLTVEIGTSLFVLGANGTGKSGLIQHFYSAHHDHARRIAAHRQTWFASNAIMLSAHDKKNAELNIIATDTTPASRWRDDYSSARPNIAIYDLFDAENARARGIAAAVDKKDIHLAQTLAKKDAPIKIINELLRLSNLQIEISIQESAQLMASKSNGQQYSIAELSDGERNVLLIAADVLTVKPETIVFIDEPERHLHRSIISPLLTLLFANRPDCAFVISTHDVLLPLDSPNARTLLLRGCSYTDNMVGAWDADLVTAESEISDDLKRDILGSRRNILFVEGAEHSLDKPIYSLIFPNVSVIAKANCRDVEHAVSGIRGADGLHWLRAFGIVDNDRRTPDEISQMRAKGVYAVSVFSVESIYYHPEIQASVTQRYSAVTGANAPGLIDKARAKAIDAVRPHIQRLSERAVEATLRQDVMQHLPCRKDIADAQPINITLDVPAVVASEVTRLTEACNNADLLVIVSRYPVHETPALDTIAKSLGFQNRAQYESAVRKLLIDDATALTFVRDLFGMLTTELLPTP